MLGLTIINDVLIAFFSSIVFLLMFVDIAIVQISSVESDVGVRFFTSHRMATKADSDHILNIVLFQVFLTFF